MIGNNVHNRTIKVITFYSTAFAFLAQMCYAQIKFLSSPVVRRKSCVVRPQSTTFPPKLLI